MPNLFFLLGPNTGLGHNSVVFMIESQIHYVADAIKKCDKLGAQALAPTRVAQDRFNDELQTQAGRLGVEHAAVVPAGISTSTAKTPCCGVATPGSTGWPPARSSPTSTSSSGSASAPNLRSTVKKLCESLRGRVHAGIVVGNDEIQK